MVRALQTKRNFLVCLCLTLFCVATDAVAASWFDRLKNALGTQDAGSLTTDEIGKGLKEALRVGAENVVDNLGQTDGFNLDPQIHIPLPKELSRVKEVLEKVGMDAMLNDLELRLNRTAEMATPKAKRLFLETIQTMTLDDVMGIYNGPEDATTQYFRLQMSDPLSAEMKPVIVEELAETGAVGAYETVINHYNDIPFVPKVDADLSQYVVDRSLDGIFYYLAKEEAAIRKDPAKRTTQLLKRVFTNAD